MKKYTVKDKTKSMSGWAKEAGISRQAMASRIRKATTPEQLEAQLTQPAGQGARSDLVEKQ